MWSLGVDQSPEAVHERATQAAIVAHRALKDSLTTEHQRTMLFNYDQASANRSALVLRESLSAQRTFRFLYLGAGLLVGGAAGYYIGKRK